MLGSRCAFCDHDTPEGSKFCNECGAPLHLAPCMHCDAVNDVLARACYRCGGALRAQADGERRVAAPVLQASAQVAHVPEAFAQTLDPIALIEPSRLRVEAPPPAEPERRPTLAQAEREPTLAPAIADDDAAAQSLVVPPDEARLAATRGMAAEARRRRTTRAALITIALLCAVPIVYYEFFSTRPLADWLHKLRNDVVHTIGERLPAVSNATPAPSGDELRGAPSGNASAPAPAAPLPTEVASPAATNPSNAAAPAGNARPGTDEPHANDEHSTGESPTAVQR